MGKQLTWTIDTLDTMPGHDEHIHNLEHNGTGHAGTVDADTPPRLSASGWTYGRSVVCTCFFTAHALINWTRY